MKVPRLNKHIMNKNVCLLKCLAYSWHEIQNVSGYTIFLLLLILLVQLWKALFPPQSLVPKEARVPSPWSQTKGGLHPGPLHLLLHHLRQVVSASFCRALSWRCWGSGPRSMGKDIQDMTDTVILNIIRTVSSTTISFILKTDKCLVWLSLR